MSLLFLLTLIACGDTKDASLDTASAIDDAPDTAPPTDTTPPPRDTTGVADDTAPPTSAPTDDQAEDADGDGAPEDQDCDDDDARRAPENAELCDGIDNDCDDLIDEDAVDAEPWYYDGDGDGFGDEADAVTICDPPDGYVREVAEGFDCDDTDPLIWPGAMERCDGRDQDCDGELDEDAADALTWYLDADGDGYGASGPTDVRACEEPDGYTSADPGLEDCDDADAAHHPGADEYCDGDDDDCDGLTDEPDAVDASTFYADTDADGYGDPDAPSAACALPIGHSDNSDDCDDDASTTHPGADEVCDAADNDCDGEADEDAVDALPFYPDADSDGYGVSVGTAYACEAPDGYADEADDCDDSDALTNPAASETCGDGIDNDCDPEPVCRLSGEHEADTADARFDGESTDDRFGAALAVHGGSTPRLLVGAPDAGSQGRAYEFHGTLTADADAADADAILYGVSSGDDAGASVAILNDLNGDGAADLLIGGPEVDERSAQDVGACYVLDGPVRGEVDLFDSYAEWAGEDAEDGAGGGVFAVGDVSGDGGEDFVVSAQGATSASGRVYVVDNDLTGERSLADAASIFKGADRDDGLGAAVSSIGDLDGDGVAELLVGAPRYDLTTGSSNAGAVYLVPGDNYGEVYIDDVAYATFVGASDTARAGSAVAGVGDVDGDGLPDFVIGAPNHQSGSLRPGAVYLFLGASVSGGGGFMVSSADALYIGAVAGEEVGASVAGAGDVDGDGYDDVLVGAPGARHDGGTDNGAAYLFYGGPAPDWSAPDLVLYGDEDDRLGAAVAGPVDVDHDGHHDLVIAAPGADDAHPDAGAVWIFLGAGQ